MFNGIYCPSITITDENGQFDFENWGRHLTNLADAGINGVLIFGSIGEFFAYTPEQKKQAIDFAVATLQGKADVLIGVGGTVMSEVTGLTEYAKDAGATGVVAISPYYFGPSAATAERYFAEVAAVGVPVMLYNFPARSGNDLTPELVRTLATRHDNIVAIKDTVDTISHTRKVIRAVKAERPDFSVLSGFDEYYLVNRVSGGDGVLSGLTNAAPEVFVAMHRAYEAGDFATAVEKASRIAQLMSVYDHADLFISAMKGAVKAATGLPITTLINEPATQLTAEQQDAIAALFA
jgi:4-hydroxy-tetrahydrodipicolinate synthase